MPQGSQVSNLESTGDLQGLSRPVYHKPRLSGPRKRKKKRKKLYSYSEPPERKARKIRTPPHVGRIISLGGSYGGG